MAGRVEAVPQGNGEAGAGGVDPAPEGLDGQPQRRRSEAALTTPGRPGVRTGEGFQGTVRPRKPACWRQGGGVQVRARGARTQEQGTDGCSQNSGEDAEQGGGPAEAQRRARRGQESDGAPHEETPRPPHGQARPDEF